MQKVAVLLTSFNRKRITLDCLHSLSNQQTNVDMDVFLCDDASSDGTVEEVQKQFPFVHLSYGTGNLYWNRGMLKAWEHASKEYMYDAYIWLNDDVKLYAEAFQEMLDCSTLMNDKAIICGCFCNKNGDFSYGGRTRNNEKILPNGNLNPVYFLNGNCVLVPQTVMDSIGKLDHMYHHHGGDFDYGLRALKKGIKIVSTRKYIGECEINNIIGNRSRKSGVTLWGRMKYLYSPLGSNPFICFRSKLRHESLKKAILMFCALHWNNILSDTAYEAKNMRKKKKNKS